MSESLLTQPWLYWAMQIQAIAQNGLAYCKNVYDIERYEQLREIAAEMLSHKTEIPKEKIKTLFCNEVGYQTPKADTRAAIFKDDKILLVQEADGRWSLPGGWVDIFETIDSNITKEVKEEAGLEVKTQFIIAIHSHHRHNNPVFPYSVFKTFVMCDLLGGEFTPNSETIASNYFALNALPELSKEKNSVEQIALCFEAYEYVKKQQIWQTQFD